MSKWPVARVAMHVTLLMHLHQRKVVMNQMQLSDAKDCCCQKWASHFWVYIDDEPPPVFMSVHTEYSIAFQKAPKRSQPLTHRTKWHIVKFITIHWLTGTTDAGHTTEPTLAADVVRAKQPSLTGSSQYTRHLAQWCKTEMLKSRWFPKDYHYHYIWVTDKSAIPQLGIPVVPHLTAAWGTFAYFTLFLEGWKCSVNRYHSTMGETLWCADHHMVWCTVCDQWHRSVIASTPYRLHALTCFAVTSTGNS